MRRLRIIAFASAILATASTAGADVTAPDVLNVIGSVTTAARPVANALVIALNLNSFEATQAFTGADGSFSLPLLRAGVYKIIAVKYGFAAASAMVIPNKKDHRVALRMQSDKHAEKDANQEIWEIRGSLPPDILHEIDMVLAPPVEFAVAADPTPKLRAQMMSMTGVAAQQSDSAFAQTAVGVQSRINENWQIGFRGNLHRIDNPADEERFGTAVAEASGMQMEVRSSDENAVRVASTKSWWRYGSTLAAQQADVRSHNLEWDHGDARLQVRYFAQENLFRTNPGSDLIEVAGTTTILQTGRSDIGVALRVAQESMHTAGNATYRTADLSAIASLDVVPAFTFRYGMSSRLGLYGTEWAPRTGGEFKIGKDTAIVVSGLYKVYSQERQNMMPTVVAFSDDSNVLPRYAYSFGIVSGDPKHDRLSAIATVSAADSPLRVVFTDGFEQFWDGLYVDNGDVRRDLRIAYRKELGNKFLVDVATSAGVARPSPTAAVQGEKAYLTGDIASTFNPTGTTLAVSYRQLHQPQANGSTEYRTERVNVRLAQSLHLPIDLRLLLGMELARNANSPFLFDAFDTDGTSRKYLGGVAMNF